MAKQIVDGYAIYNLFSNDTQFISYPFAALIDALNNSPCSETELMVILEENIDTQTTENETETLFQQFITQAIESKIITNR